MSDRWSASVGPHGHTVRVEERTRGGNVYLISWNGDRGTHEKTSLGFPVRDADGDLIDEAVDRAKAAAAEASNALIRGEDPLIDDEPEPATLGEVADLFRSEEIVDMTGRHRDEVEREVDLFERYFGRDLELGTLGPREWNSLRRDRESGRIDSHGTPVEDKDNRTERSVRTTQKTLKVLRQLCRFAAQWRRPDGSFLLPDGDPTRGLDLPTPTDPRRPICDDDLLAGMLAAADDHTIRGADGDERRSCLRELTLVAAGTGARIGSILALRWSDWDPDGATYGTLTWRGDEQKNGRTRTTPVPESVADALREQRRRRPGVGEAPVFPAPDSCGAVGVDTAIKWLQDVEKAARGRHVKGFGFHALRRRWANRMKDRSPVDVAHLGGWSGPQVMENVYQRATLDDMDRTLKAGDPGRVAGGEG